MFYSFTPHKDGPSRSSFPPFYVKPWKEDLCICSVETVRLILLERNHLCLQHNAIFFSWTHPHKPLDAAAFNRCFQYCLIRAGIQATSGSTRSVAASAALARGASLSDVLRLGDWSNASTYFRFYHTL
jgi:hypothetical protein